MLRLGRRMRDVVRGDFALLDGDVDDLMRPGAIARRVNVRRAGLHFRIGDDPAVVASRRRPFASPVRRCSATRPMREENFLRHGPQNFAMLMERHSLAPSLAEGSSNFVSVQTRMPSRRSTFSTTAAASASNSRSSCPLRWISVTSTSNRRKELRQFDRHRAAAQDNQRPGQFAQRQRVIAGQKSDFRQARHVHAARPPNRC